MGAPAPIIIIIIPSCLRVDKAITFFISISNMAAHPAINIVKVPIVIKIIDIFDPLSKTFIRINK